VNRGNWARARVRVNGVNWARVRVRVNWARVRVRVNWARVRVRVVEALGGAEIGDSDCARRVQKDVGGLDVGVHDFARMEVREAAQDRARNGRGHRLGEPAARRRAHQV
jgi:hypothetical protein